MLGLAMVCAIPLLLLLRLLILSFVDAVVPEDIVIVVVVVRVEVGVTVLVELVGFVGVIESLLE